MKILRRLNFRNWSKYLFEFLSVFIAVTFAFVLNRWNDDRKDSIAEDKILTEINNGLARDSLDIEYDESYYKVAFRGLKYFNKIIDGDTIQNDSLVNFYFLFAREFLVVQNKSGYEALKSRGLETIQNDSLRTKIIQLYEVDYELARKFNEEHSEYKFMQNYFHKINDAFAPNFEYDETDNIKGIKLPLEISEKERRLLKSYIWKIRVGKNDRYKAAQNVKLKISHLRKDIQKYLDDKS